VGENVVLDGTASYDVDDSDFVATYIWTIEEESGFTWLDANRTNPSSLITFAVPGQYHVNLQVTDSHGGKSVQTADSRLQVLVETDPIALACQVNGSCDSLTIPLREVLYLDGTGSTDADGTIDKYRWYIAKRPAGEEELFSTEALPTYIFTDAGYYDIYLEVEDNSGRTSERASLTVSAVENDNVKIEIAWTNGGNVDLHYIRPGHAFGTSGDCNKQNKTPDWEDEGTPQFIQDSLDGSLPEIVVHSNPGDGIYTVRAEYFEATESCGWEEGECSWYEDNCGLCGCSCPSWLCGIKAFCCNSCWQCEQQWVCVDKPTQVTFYIYLNGSASPDMIVTGESYKIPGVPGHVDFSLHRENGKFIVD